MQKKIFRGALLLTLVSALLLGALSAGVSYSLSERQLKTQLAQEATLLASLREEVPATEGFLQTLAGLALQNRLTWIAADGTVRYDNQGRAETMQNHLDRQEIVEAEKSGTGYAKRYSNTLLEEQLYCAVKLSDGSYLRLAATQRTLGGQMGELVWALLFGIAAIALLASLLSRHWTRRLVRPINEIDLENPLSNHVYDELSPMLRRMAEQNRKLEMQLREIGDRRSELDAIIEHMNEGLLILDERRHVLMINDSARRILRTDRPLDGQTGLAVYNRSQPLLDAVDTAMETGSAHAQMQSNGREYLLTASVVRRREGLVLLLRDVTEQNQAEQARKRFTANVSHELRTPLTTISGYAELLQNGMAQPQDVPVFARKIYNESRRLLQLIEDILHLSKLDEGYASGRMEPVELLAAARRALSENEEAARERNITLVAEGEEAEITGDPTLIDEMLRNLIENGVKYNHQGGEVRVKVARGDHEALVTVRDTGIGIPPEHQSRVFERFYRVDSSRSKQTGGTGLGLSIVKHGAQFHHASIALTSETGAGTTVELAFPLAH